MDIITMTLGAGLFIQSILLAKDAYDVDRASNSGLVVEELANTSSSRGRVSKSNQKRIERLEKQIFQLQVFHAQHHPEQGSDIIEGNKSSPDPES